MREEKTAGVFFTLLLRRCFFFFVSPVSSAAETDNKTAKSNANAIWSRTASTERMECCWLSCEHPRHWYSRPLQLLHTDSEQHCTANTTYWSRFHFTPRHVQAEHLDTQLYIFTPRYPKAPSHTHKKSEQVPWLWFEIKHTGHGGQFYSTLLWKFASSLLHEPR